MKMRRISAWTVVVLCAVALASASIASASSAATGFALAAWTTAPSGWSENGAFLLEGSSGQADAGVMSGGSFALTGGFWQPAEVTHAVHLPIVTK